MRSAPAGSSSARWWDIQARPPLSTARNASVGEVDSRARTRVIDAPLATPPVASTRAVEARSTVTHVRDSDAMALSCAQLRRIDALAESEYGLPPIVLMENAGRGAAESALRWFAPFRGRRDGAIRALVLTGSGNNGGDGCVVARHLAIAGVDVDVLATHSMDELRPDHRVMRQAVEAMGLVRSKFAGTEGIDALAARLGDAELVFDGLLGTGFAGRVRPELARVIECVNAARARARDGSPFPAGVVALDLPSGLDGDTGAPSNATIAADLTLSFVARKRGFDAPAARAFVGRVDVVGIGVPTELIARVRAEGGAAGVK